MEIKQIIELLKKERDLRKDKLEFKKDNINNYYILAKLDFTTIENLEDVLSTYDIIIGELESLQNRIIERNRKS